MGDSMRFLELTECEIKEDKRSDESGQSESNSIDYGEFICSNCHVHEKDAEIKRMMEHVKDMPENVKKAVFIAASKKKHTDFYYKLDQLNDKIQIFTKLFYSKNLSHETQFQERKKKQEIE